MALFSFLQFFFPSIIWRKKTHHKIVYLTFDDGPHPHATPFVLDELKRFGAKGTFFCLGKNISQFPEIYKRLIAEGHQIGHHSFSHPDGWKTKTVDYLSDVEKGAIGISSGLFRPPYGRLTFSQFSKLKKKYQVVMWDVSSSDYAPSLNKVKSLKHLLRNSKNGSIILFHDSTASFENIKYLLPEFLKHFSKLGFRFDSL